MKIKTHKYLKELEKAERRGYEKGRRETEDRIWNMENQTEKERRDEEFKAKVIRRLDMHERKFSALCEEMKVTEPVEAEEYEKRCENAAVCNAIR